MNRWKVAFWAAVTALLATNLFWLYIGIDSGVSYGYLSDSYNLERKATADLGAIIVQGARDYTRKDILHLLRQAKPAAFIVEDDDKIIFDGVVLQFDGDRLLNIGDAR